MSEAAQIGATFPPDGLLHVADRAGLYGVSPGATVRFLAYLAAGLSWDEARNRVLPRKVPLSIFDERSAREQVRIPQDVADQIHTRHPGKPVPWVLRFYMAKTNGASDRQAESIADGYKAGRPKGSPDSYQRTRRSKAGAPDS